MKTLRLLVLAIASIVAACSTSLAGIKQVTGLSTSAAATIVVPGNYCRTIIIQNNGSNAVRLSLDGGSSYTDPATGKTGTNPTTSTGYLLAAGQQLVINAVQNNAATHKPVVAIMATGTTTLDIVTDDPPGSNASSTFPTN